MRNGLGLGRFCRRIRAAWRALTIAVLSGIVHALRNGGRWADCPREVYGPKKTLYNRFVRWAERGIWERIFSALAGGEDAPDRLFIDSTCIKVHRCAGGGKGGPWPMASAAPRGAATPSSTLSAMRKACQERPDCSPLVEACRPPSWVSPTRAMTAKPCRSGPENHGRHRKNRKVQYHYDRLQAAQHHRAHVVLPPHCAYRKPCRQHQKLHRPSRRRRCNDGGL